MSASDHTPTIPLTQAERDAFAETVAWLRHPSQSYADAFQPLEEDGVEWVGYRTRAGTCSNCGHRGPVEAIDAGV